VFDPPHTLLLPGSRPHRPRTPHLPQIREPIMDSTGELEIDKFLRLATQSPSPGPLPRTSLRESFVRVAASGLGLEYELEHVTDLYAYIADTSPQTSHRREIPSLGREPDFNSYLTPTTPSRNAYGEADFGPSYVRSDQASMSRTGLAPTLSQADDFQISGANLTKQAHNYPSVSQQQPRNHLSNTDMPPEPIPFNYPPLDSMSGLHDPRPYMTTERDFQGIPEHDYEQHHNQHDGLTRYPSPPHAGLSDNPYNQVQQQLSDAVHNGEPDLAVETKSESDPASPGRSKPIPKPDREVTKLENGRFYCNWPNCTEDVKDFGRKCEWR
jgi:hypothetical protein